jgi:CheY-like chemotaxis protein
METHAPTVLIVDDDPNMIKILQKRILSETFLGVAAVSTMRIAKKLIDNENFKFSAIIADLGFMPQTQDYQSGLYDGIDLLAHAEKKRPNIEKFVISVYSDNEVYKKSASDQNVRVNKWYEKLEINTTKPWKEIERQLFLQKLNESRTGKELLKKRDGNEDIDNFISAIHESMRPLTRSYLTTLSDESYEVIQPIEVIGSTEDDLFYLSALNIGLTQPGVGYDFNEAMNELKELILSYYEHITELYSTQPDKVVERLQEAIGSYVRKLA